MAIYLDKHVAIKVTPTELSEAAKRKQYLAQLYREINDGIALEKWRYANSIKKELGRENQGAYAILPEIGEKVRSYDARNFFRQMSRDRYFWEDKSTREQFAKDNPEVVCTK